MAAGIKVIQRTSMPLPDRVDPTPSNGPSRPGPAGMRRFNLC